MSAPSAAPVRPVRPAQTSVRRLGAGAFRRVVSCAAVAVAIAGLLSPFSVSAAEWALSGALGAHDPSLIKDGDTWWCFTTGAGLPVKYSADGQVWKQGTPLFSSELSWWRTYAPAMGALDVWAPDIQKFGDRSWCYYSVSEFGKNNSAIGLKSCTSIAAGDWRDDGFVIGSRSGVDAYNAIDPHLTTDAAGNPWLVFGSWFSGIQIVRLDPATMKPGGSPHPIASRNGGIEGPSVVYVDGYYYLFVSIDVCCNGVNSTYKIACGRSRDITGPYLTRDGSEMLDGHTTLLLAGDTRWKGPGGQEVHREGDDWILTHHAYDANNRGSPTLRIRDLFWDNERWPSLTAPASVAPSPPSDAGAYAFAPGRVAVTWIPASGGPPPAHYSVERALDSAFSLGLTRFTVAAETTSLLDETAPADTACFYRISAVNATGSSSPSATLEVAPSSPGTTGSSALTNISTRAYCATGNRVTIGGFIVAGTASKRVLLRAVGPTLTRYGLAAEEVLTDPIVSVHHGDAVIATNDNWTDNGNAAEITAVSAQFGAAALADNDRTSSALLLDLAPGAYTFVASGKDQASGIVLVEVYDLDAATSDTRVVNISSRAHASTGNGVTIGGFIISGDAPQQVLLRAVGTTLTNFGLGATEVLTDPRITVHAGAPVIAVNDDWSENHNAAEILTAATRAGATPFDAADVNSSALLLTLQPGLYTFIARGSDDRTGVVLVEVYAVP